jgi:hypothetical protein
MTTKRKARASASTAATNAGAPMTRDEMEAALAAPELDQARDFAERLDGLRAQIVAAAKEAKTAKGAKALAEIAGRIVTPDQIKAATERAKARKAANAG